MKWIATMLLLLMTGAFAQSGEVVITEILYNPASDEGTTLTQAIEIVNTTGSPINLNNWTIDDEDGDGPNTLPNVTLPGFGIAVICGGSAADFTSAFGSTAGYVLISLSDEAQTFFNLSNSPSATSEIIQLRDDIGGLVDEVNFDDSGDWPSDGGSSWSIYLALPNGSINEANNDDGTNWSRSFDGVDGGYLSTAGATWNAVETTSLGIINGDNSLPVALSAFAASAGDQRVTIRWTTQSEINNVGFEVLRSTSESGSYDLYASYLNESSLRGQFNTQETTNYRFVDIFVSNEVTYFYKLVDVDVNGTRTEHGPVSATPRISAVDVTTVSSNAPATFALNQNYPNPFNPTTQIPFDIAQVQGSSLVDVRIDIFNALGQKIRSLYNGQLEPGQHEVTWNSTNEYGNVVPAGIYFVVLQTPNFVRTSKMTLLK